MSNLFASGVGALMAKICCLIVLLSTISLVASVDLPGSDKSLVLAQQVPEVQPGQTRIPSGGRRLLATVCRGTDISITQQQTGTTNTGIPKFTVNIVNLCVNSCAPWNVHVYCGAFASAVLVNPNYFKRLAVDDCLVNNGFGLHYGNVISFTYAQSSKYNIRFRSMQWC